MAPDLKTAQLHVALVHYPIYDRKKNIVATNITNFDIHDIARVCRCYGVHTYHLIHPSQEQLMFVSRIKEHWRIGFGKKFNPLRSMALEHIDTATSLEDLRAKHKIDKVYATSAKVHEGYHGLSFASLKEQIHTEPNQSLLLLFGTGFGLSPEVFKACDGILEPIQGSPLTDFRHLSVRSAVGIALDRLVGS